MVLSEPLAGSRQRLAHITAALPNRHPKACFLSETQTTRTTVYEQLSYFIWFERTL